MNTAFGVCLLNRNELLSITKECENLFAYCYIKSIRAKISHLTSAIFVYIYNF